MNKLYKIYLLIFALAFTVSIAAQKHEVSVYGMGGSSYLKTNITNVTDISSKNKIGGGIGVNYNYNIIPSLAILTGVELASYKSKFEFESLSSSYTTVDDENHAVDFAYSINGYKEDLSALYMNIPLMVRYTYPVNSKLGVYAAAGGKIGFLLNGRFKNSYSSLNTSGTYSEWGHGSEFPVIDDSPELGFGKMGGGASKGDVDFDMMYMTAAELGLKYNLCEKYSLYFGGYFDYALNDIYKKKNSKLFVEYNNQNPSVVGRNSISNSTYAPGASGFIKDMRPVSIGIRIRLSYKL